MSINVRVSPRENRGKKGMAFLDSRIKASPKAGGRGFMMVFICCGQR